MSPSPSTHPIKPNADAHPLVWHQYWVAAEQGWRYAPEIDAVRQSQLETRLVANKDAPFANCPLDRADIEWLTQKLLGYPNSSHDWSGHQFFEPRQAVDVGDEPVGLNLKQALLPLGKLRGLNLSCANLEGAYLIGADLEAARLWRALLKGTRLRDANLVNADLTAANLQRADLERADLEGARLFHASLEGAFLHQAKLGRADMQCATLDRSTDLSEALLSDGNRRGPKVADVQWGDVNLATLNWDELPILDDAHLPSYVIGWGHPEAAKANLQFATVLRDQGLNQIAHQYAYRARVEERKDQFWRATVEFRSIPAKIDAALGRWVDKIVTGVSSQQAVAPSPERGRPSASALPGDLTAEEDKIIGLTSDGLTNEYIADELKLSTVTVESVLSNAMVKLGLPTPPVSTQSPRTTIIHLRL